MTRGVPITADKQQRIKQLLREGKSYNEIAAELNIAVNSVGNFLKREMIHSYMKQTGRL